MRPHTIAPALAAIALAAALPASAQPAEPQWAKVDAVFGAAGKDLPGGVHRFGWPRRDLRVKVGEVAVQPALALGSWGAFVKTGGDGKPTWAFREPIATLLADGKTVGRHYAGPTWEHSDGSAVVGKVAGSAPGATPNDISWLKLEVISRRGSGVLTGVTTVQRINTQGGKLGGACDTVGTYRSVSYSADYVFLRKA